MNWADFGFALKKIISSLILPPGGLALLIAIGAVVAWRRRGLGLTIVGCGTALLFAATLPGVAHHLQSTLESTIPPWQPDRWAKATPGAAALKKPQAIVILGGGSLQGAREYGGETLKSQTLRRVRYGARVARQTGLPILVTGGKPPGAKYPEAVLMAYTLRDDFGVSAHWIEERARDTSDNAAYSIAILRGAGIDTAVLVTDVTHMPRAMREFESRGFRVIPAATNYQGRDGFAWSDIVPSISAFNLSCEATYEWLGRVWQAFRRVFE